MPVRATQQQDDRIYNKSVKRRRKKVAWAWVGGVGDAPEVPFCAAQLLTDNVIPEDFSYIPVFADFERCIAWTWLEMMQDKKEPK